MVSYFRGPKHRTFVCCILGSRGEEESPSGVACKCSGLAQPIPADIGWMKYQTVKRAEGDNALAACK